MVLTEAFAAGTPVVASDIAGYRDVVRDGVDGVLVPPGDAQALAEALRDLYDEPERRAEMARAAADDVERFAWPRVAARGDGGLRGRDRDAAARRARRSAPRSRSASARPTSSRASRAQRLPSLEPTAPRAARRAGAGARSAVAGSRRSRSAALVLAYLALQQDRHRQHRHGAAQLEPVVRAARPGDDVRRDGAARASPGTRSCKAALPQSARSGSSDAMQGTFIGVLMSSTLPARLGEPSRALVVARRTGRPRENLPVVLGTLVSQTLLNIVALVDPRRGHVLVGRPLQRPPERAAGRRDRAARRCWSLVLLAPVVLRPAPATRASARAARAAGAGARARWPACAPGWSVFRQPAARARPRRSRSSRAWALQWLSCYVLLVALGLGRPDRPRRRGRGPVRGQHHRGAAGHAGQPRRLPGRLRGRAAHRLARRLRRRASPTA